MESEKILAEILEKLRQRLAETRRTMFASSPNQQEAYYAGKATGFAEAIEFVSEVFATEREIAAEEKGEGVENSPLLN